MALVFNPFSGNFDVIGADQKLSNLQSPTAINQDLLPAINAGVSLGTDGLTFLNVQAQTLLAETVQNLGHNPVISLAANTLLDTTGSTSIDFSSPTGPTTVTQMPNNSSTKIATTAYVDTAINALPDPIVYKGTWNAATNTPALANSNTGVEGFLYQVSAPGTVNFGAGPISFEIGDKVVNNGSQWQKWDMTDAVMSVNGQTGVVILSTTDIAEGTNLYYTDAKARAAISATAPITYASGVIGITQASTLANGYLSSTDFTTFNNKFTLPSLTSGSVLFSNGTTISQDNANFFWDNVNKRLGIGQNGVAVSAIFDAHENGNSVPHFQANDLGPASTTSGGVYQALLDPNQALPINSRIGSYQFAGSKNPGRVLQTTAGITAVTTEQWSPTVGGTKLTFETTPNGSNTRALSLLIDQDKSVTFYGNLLPNLTGTINLGSSSLVYNGLFANTLSNSAGAQLSVLNRSLQFNGADVVSWFNNGLALSTNKLLRFTTGDSHTIDLVPPAVGANQSYTLPTTVPSISGQALTSDTSGNMSWASVMTNPMTTGGDVIYGGASGVPTRLANGTTGQYLKSTGGTTAPVWTSFTAPTIQKFTSGSGTYTTPANVKYIKVEMVGGGGGGGGSGTGTPGNGGNGGATTFGTTLLSASGGGGGQGVSGAVPSGGSRGSTIVLNSPAIGSSFAGSTGSAGNLQANSVGGAGGPSFFGGAGFPTNQGAGVDGSPNSGAGASGAGTNGCGGGGGSGAYLDAIIPNPLATYSYAVGSGGTAGTTGTAGQPGGTGAAGIIIVTEFYQ